MQVLLLITMLCTRVCLYKVDHIGICFTWGNKKGVGLLIEG